MMACQLNVQRFLFCTCVIAMLLLPDIDAWTAGITTNPTKGQLARSCSLLSLKAAATSNVPLGIDNDERHATSDVRNSYAIMSLDEAVLKRYSCKKFRRYQPQNTTIASIFVATSLPLENEPTLTRPEPERLLASGSDPSVIQRAIESLNLARRTPTAFNTQPYKVVLVSSPEQKMAVSQYCLGPNRQRVQDADCTVIFLADKQIMRTFPTFRKLIKNIGIVKKNRPLTTKAMLKLQFYISIFSSGYPFPRFISSTISFAVRTCMAWMHFVLKWFSYPLPSLSNAETWAARQVMMVAMTYMLACTARGLATIPMEGINASGIRKVINAPSRYAIPIIVSTGIPYDQSKLITTSIDAQDDTNFHDRYRIDELMYGDSFGCSLPMISD